MKMFLLLATGSVIVAGALPSVPAKIILSTFVLMTALIEAARRAPVGYQDEGGFHPVGLGQVSDRRTQRKLWRTRRRLFLNWLFSDLRRPAKT